MELLGLGTIQIDVREPEPHTEEQEDLETSTVEHNIETDTLEENMETDNMEEENEEDGDKSSTTSHSGGITSSESEAEEDEFDETFNGGGQRGEVEVGGDEIQTYQVVWARYRGWPWWPGVVSPATRRRGRTLLRRVEYFGCDDRGRNTHSELVTGTRVVFIRKTESFSCRERRTSNHSVVRRRRQSTSLKWRECTPPGEDSWRPGRLLLRVSYVDILHYLFGMKDKEILEGL